MTATSKGPRLATLAVGALLALLTAGTARAQVTYMFTGGWGEPSSGPLAQTFTLNLTGYVAADTTYSFADLTTCESALLACTDIRFEMADINKPALSVIKFKTEYLTQHYYFTSGAFSQPGSHTAVYSGYFGSAVLQVTGPAVPEPPTTLLAIGAMAAWRGRRCIAPLVGARLLAAAAAA